MVMPSSGFQHRSLRPAHPIWCACLVLLSFLCPVPLSNWTPQRNLGPSLFFPAPSSILILNLVLKMRAGHHSPCLSQRSYQTEIFCRQLHTSVGFFGEAREGAHNIMVIESERYNSRTLRYNSEHAIFAMIG